MSDENFEEFEEAHDAEGVAPVNSDEAPEPQEAAGNSGPANESESSSSIFDAFEPPPEIDPNRFGPIPIVTDADVVQQSETVNISAAAVSVPAVRAVRDLAPGVESVQLGEVSPEPQLGEATSGEVAVAEDLPTRRESDSEVLSDAAVVFDMDAGEHEAGEHDSVDQSPSDAGALLADLFGDDPDPATIEIPPTGDNPEQASVSTPNVEVEPPSDLPHWTEPATGQVPAVVSGEQDEVWSDLSGPRWHGEGPEWAGDDIADVFGFTPVVEGDAKIDDDAHQNEDLPGIAGSPQRAPIPRRQQASAQAPSSSSGAGRNIPQAIMVGAAAAGLALVAFYFGNVTTLTLITVLAVLGSLELFNKMREVGVHPATLLGVVASASLPVAVYHRGPAGFMLVATFSVVFGALWYIAGADSHRPALNIGLTELGILWVGGLASFASLIILLPDGISILLFAVVTTVVFDTAAYAGGRAFGKRPFHPASPNKTWEGTLAGVVGAVAAAFVLGLFKISPFSADLKHAAIVGLVVGILGPLGDLTESMIKRDLGVKDMGTLLPGHGGILDRIDGLLFVLPGVYYLALILL